MKFESEKLEIEVVKTTLDNILFNVETRINASTGNTVYLSVNYKGEYFVKYNNHIGAYDFTYALTLKLAIWY